MVQDKVTSIDIDRNELLNGVCKTELNNMGINDDDLYKKMNERFCEIVEYTGESAEVVANKMNTSINTAVSLWNQNSPHGLNGLTNFHSITERKIYSPTALCDYLAVIREKIMQRITVPSTLLDFGGSHGHVSLAAAEKGVDVTYADIGSKVSEFLQWKVSKRHLKIEFAPVVGNRCIFNNKTYNFIVCLDVASHLPNLKQYMVDFWYSLKDGGELFFGDDLFDFTLPWHLEENKKYCDLQEKRGLFNGFTFIDHLWANCSIWRKE